MSFVVTCGRLALAVRRVSLKTQIFSIKNQKFYCPSIQYAFSLKNYSQLKKVEPELKPPETILKASPIWIEQLNKSEIDFKILPDLCESLLRQEEHVTTLNVGKLWQSVCARHIYSERKVNQAIQMFNYLQTLNPDNVQPAAYAILMGSFRGTGKQHEQVIFEIWEKLKEFSDLFPAILQPYIAQGFCETSRWKEALDLIEMEKELAANASMHLWKPIIIKAIKEGDAEVTSSLLNRLTYSVNFGLKFHINSLVEEMFELVKDDQVEFNMKDLCDILEIMRHLPDQSIADNIMKYFNEEMQQWKCVSNVFRKRPHCHSCGHKWPAVKINENELKGLNDQILHKLLLQSDVYLNTNPDEIEHFLKMVKIEGPFDVVIDGCNIGIGKFKGGKKILLAVDYLKQNNAKKILVIGKDHMKNWKYMNEVAEKAIFLPLDNKSKDDAFILYAASRSPDTYFVSHDNYSNHLHGDVDKEYFPLFCKWLFHRQIKHYHFSDKKVDVVHPLETDMVPCYDNQTYHIPYMSDDKIFWLCARKKL